MSRPCGECPEWTRCPRRLVAPGIVFTDPWGTCQKTGEMTHADKDCDQPEPEEKEKDHAQDAALDE